MLVSPVTLYVNYYNGEIIMLQENLKYREALLKVDSKHLSRIDVVKGYVDFFSGFKGGYFLLNYASDWKLNWIYVNQ